jgi:hypothetical protein
VQFSNEEDIIRSPSGPFVIPPRQGTYEDYLPAGRDPNSYSPMNSRFSDASLACTEDETGFTFSLQSSISSLSTIPEDVNTLPNPFDARTAHYNRLDALHPPLATREAEVAQIEAYSRANPLKRDDKIRVHLMFQLRFNYIKIKNELGFTYHQISHVIQSRDLTPRSRRNNRGIKINTPQSRRLVDWIRESPSHHIIK